MDTVKIEKKQVKLIAHRGLSGLETENSSAAFVAAGNRSYFGIETDVHMTADGKFVVCHDENISRVSGVNMVIEESTYEELSKVRLLSKEDQRVRQDLVIPTLSEYIRICKKYEKTAVLELKTPFSNKQTKEIISEISAENYIDKTIFISFYWDNLNLVRQILPDQPVQFLVMMCDDELIAQLAKNRFDLDILHTAVTKELVEKLHKNGIKINAWTCNKPNDAERLINCGVDYITTNILE